MHCRSLSRRSSALVLLVVSLLLAPAVAGGVPADTGYGQQGTATTDAGTAGNVTSGGGGPLGLVTGALGAVGAFLFGTTVGNALVGIPLGLYLGLKAIALYLEYYE